MRPINIEMEREQISPDRLVLIRAGLMGASFHLPHEEVFLFPFLDYLQLLFQPTLKENPIAFLFWRQGKCIYSSFSDLYYTKKYDLQLQNGIDLPDVGIQLSTSEDLWLSVHRVNTEKLKDLEKKFSDIAETQYPVTLTQEERELILPPDEELMAQVGLVLKRPESDRSGHWRGLSDSVFKQIAEPLTRSATIDRLPYPWCPAKDTTLNELSYAEDILPYLGGFRRVLDDVFEDVRASLTTERYSNTPQLGNVFCVIRTVPSGKRRLGAFPYTAGLLPSDKQRSILRAWCEKGCAGKKKGGCPIDLGMNGNCATDIEAPLGSFSRSIADTVFCSGIIDFGRHPADQVWDRTDPDNPAEQRRRKVEACIYPPRDQASLYYVPIHVEGLPWLSIFTFSPVGESQERWVHNYTFYRDVIQKAASRMRLEATNEYLAIASEIASSNIDTYTRSPDLICEAVNRSWEVIARIFPMPLFQLHHGQPHSTGVTDSTTIAQSCSANWFVTCRTDGGREDTWPNPYFGPPQVKWGRSAPQALLDKLVTRIKAQQEKRWQLLEASGQSLAKVAHAMQTQLNSMGTAINRIEVVSKPV